MTALLAIAGFELRHRLKLISTWVYFAVFFALAVLWTLATGGAFPGVSVSFGSEKLWVNAPLALMASVGFLSVFALPVISAVMGRAVQQDFETNTHSAFFTSPISKLAYLGGRFVAALVVLLVVLSSVALGSAFALALPVIDGARSGEVGVWPYVWPYVVLVLPNLVMMGAVFFTVGALTRRMLPVYITSAILLVGYLVASSLTADLETRWISSLADPFGINTVLNVTAYWPIAERNTRLVPLAGDLLINRAAWLALAALPLLAGYRRFKLAEAGATGRRRDKPVAEDAPPAGLDDRWKHALPARPRWLPVLVSLSWLQFKETVKNVYFLVIVLTGLLLVIANASALGSLYGTNTYPVTYKMLDVVGGQFGIFVLILITFYSGELVWRERDHRVDQIHDAMPLPTWVMLSGKLVALMLVPVVVQLVVMVAGMALQLVKGYTHLEPGLYLHQLFGLQLINYWGLCVLAFAVQVIVNHKYLGHFVMVVYFIVMTFAGSLGLEHRLILPFQIGTPTYSDMNGYGHYLARIRWLQLYWGMFGVGLVVLARVFWQRGTVVGARSRFAVARRRLTLPVRLGAAVALLGMAGAGAVIFYNTNVLNRYVPRSAQRAASAAYEKAYRARLLNLPQARLTAANVNVDLFPSTQRVRAAGRFVLTNKNAVPVHEVWVNLPDEVTSDVARLALDRPARLVAEDHAFGVRGFQLAAPLAPGESVTLAFDLTSGARGFVNGAPYTEVVGNGSFVNNEQVLPTLGYREGEELDKDHERAAQGLAPRERMRDRADPAGLARNYVTSSADWITFECVVSTEPDQLAIAPGYLQKEWQDHGRRYFQYKMDSPILNFYAFLSARYEVKRDRWNDVAIEVYYHPGHEYNLDRMIAATKDSLAYFTRAFGPYQHRQFRILEFPRYAQFAQAFPNTIPYSEAIGFMAQVDDTDSDDLDYPYYVTAHEMAHQWWAHQVIGANVQGATMLSESLAQYSALMVMKQRYGDAKMKRFLRYELDRYLRGRAVESKREVPLAKVEGQAYIHYGKGSLVMYALQDYLGEAKVNAAIKEFRDANAYRGPPYPTTPCDARRHPSSRT